MASASPATLPDSIRLNAPPLRSLLHFSSRSPSPEQSRDTHLHSPAVHSTRISHRHHCGRCDLYHVLFSSLLPSANSCHSFRLSLTFIHSFIGLCLSLPLFHDSIPSFRLQYRSSVDQISCSQPAANLFVPFSTPERCHEPRLPPEPLRSFDLDPAQEVRAKLYIYSFGSLNLVPCLADYFLTIITTSHRLRWTFTFDSTRPSKPSKACFYHKLYECSNQRIPKCPRHLHRPLRPPQLTVQHPADHRAKAPSLNSKRIKSDREPHRTNCLR